jgi:hypothetical protein
LKELVCILQLDKVTQQLQQLQKDVEAARSAEASARGRTAAAEKLQATQAAEAEAAAANLRLEHNAELARLSNARKKAEVWLRILQVVHLSKQLVGSLLPAR